MGGVVLPGSPFPITLADSASLSSFGRLNTNQPSAIFTSQQQYGDDPTVWESSLSGTGANTFLPNESTISMSTGGTASGAASKRQTRLFMRYVPGYGLTTFMTFCMVGGATYTNNVRRVGLFDDENGVFLEVSGTTVSLVQRTFTSGSASDAEKVAQASWNVDTFNGLGPSGITIDWSKAQILVIDLQWLGVGRVRVGFDINGVFYPAHYFLNANLRTSVYMTTANLPLRYENVNAGVSNGTAVLKHICAAAMAGGGAELASGHQYTYSGNGGAGTAVSNGHRRPIISVRAKTTGPNGVRNTGQIEIQETDVACIGLNPIFWELVLNPTLTGASFAAYNASNSIADVDLAATALTGGTVLDSGYLASSGSYKGGATSRIDDIKQHILSYSGLLSQQDIMTLVCSAPSGNTTAFCSMSWLERW